MAGVFVETSLAHISYLISDCLVWFYLFIYMSELFTSSSSWQNPFFFPSCPRINAASRKNNSQDQRVFLHWHGHQILAFWLWRIAGVSPRHLICLSKPSHRETKPPSNASLLSLDLSLATCLPLLSCWQRLTRHDVQLERLFAFTLLPRTVQRAVF